MIVVVSCFALVRPLAADPFVAFIILTAMVSLITPSQASYHYLLLIPGIAGLIVTTRGWIRAFSVVAFALVCSNLTTVMAFSRAYLMIALWMVLMLAARPRIKAPVVFAVILVFSAVSGYSEYGAGGWMKLIAPRWPFRRNVGSWKLNQDSFPAILFSNLSAPRGSSPGRSRPINEGTRRADRLTAGGSPMPRKSGGTGILHSAR